VLVAMPTFRGFVLPRLAYWAGAVSLKDAPIQKPNTPAGREELVKVVRRAYLESLPVLHLAQAYYVATAPLLRDRAGAGLAGLILEMQATAPNWIWAAAAKCVEAPGEPVLFAENSGSVLIRMPETSPIQRDSSPISG
jgi:hypothetical protein